VYNSAWPGSQFNNMVSRLVYCGDIWSTS